MLSLENEIRTLHESGSIRDDPARLLIAIARREVFSIHRELRALFWASVALLVSGVGVLLARNVDQIGHLTIIALISLVSAGCYGFAWRGRTRGVPSPASEYVLLLGALLLSADLGYAEAQYRFFGDAWTRHLLILAVVHAVIAYLFESRLVLSLAIMSMAGWLGVDREGVFLSGSGVEGGARLLAAAALALSWRTAHATLLPGGGKNGTFRAKLIDHFVAHFALFGTLVWVFDESVDWVGLAVLIPFCVVSVLVGVRTNRELFVVYGIAYGLVGIDAVVLGKIHDDLFSFIYLLVSTPPAIVLLWMVHGRWGNEW